MESKLKKCDVCGKPIESKTGCHRCTVPAKQWVRDGWGQARHLPDRSDHDYVNLLKSFGFHDHEMMAFFNEYLMAMMSHYKGFTPKEFAVAHYLYSKCMKSGRVFASLNEISEATGVSRDTLRVRADKPNSRSVIENLKDSGVLEEFDDEPKGAKKRSFYLRCRWNPRAKLNISLERRDEAFRLAMMNPEQKKNYHNKQKNKKRKAKLREKK